jgi:hypothetical protein
MGDVLAIPGYLSAVIKERTVRDAAFLGITESIGAFKVIPMTLRIWTLLRMLGNTLMHDEGLPSPNELKEFLWLLSPDFTPEMSLKKRRFEKLCRKTFFFPTYLALWNSKRARARYKRKCDERLIAAAKLIDAARAYMKETMQDRPPSPKSQGFDVDYFSDPAYFCSLFGREFGWTQEETLNTPLKRIFQYINAIKQYHGSKIPMCNPSDSVKAAWMRSVRDQKSEAQ